VADTSREMTIAARGIGIDVGACSVKVAIVRRALGGVVLEHVVEQPVERQEAGRPSPEAVAAAVATAMEEVRVGRALVVAGAPTQLSTVRNLDVPFSDEVKIRQVVKTEVEPHLPFSAEDIVVDYCLTGVEREAPAGEEGIPVPTNLLITAVQKKLVGDLLGTVRGDELDAEVVEVEFMGAFSAVRTLAPETVEGGELIIDIGAVKTSVIFARKGCPLAVRAFNFGGDILTQALAEAKSASFTDAEHDKKAIEDPLGPTEEASDAGRVLADALAGLRRGLDQTLRFFSGQVGEVDYDRVMLTGGSAALKGLDAWLAAALGKDVAVLDSLGQVKNTAGDEVAVARFATAIGLGLRGIGESVSLQNFRQEELAYPNPLKRLVKYLAPAVALIVLIIAAIGARYYISYQNTLAKAEKLQRLQDSELRTVLGDQAYVTLDGTREVVDERAAEFESLSGENPRSVLDVLKELSKICYGSKEPPEGAIQATNDEAAHKALIERSAPWKIQVWEFQMERGRVEIEGVAANYPAINQLKRALEESPLFREVQVRSSKTMPDGRTTLIMRIYLEER